MSNRKHISNFIRNQLDILKEDPLLLTKVYLNHYNINYKDFFSWIAEEAKRFNFSINNDKDVLIFLQ